MGAVERGRNETESSCNAIVLGTHDDSALRPLVMRLVLVDYVVADLVQAGEALSATCIEKGRPCFTTSTSMTPLSI